MNQPTSEGSASATRIWDAIKPLPDSERPDVSLRPYLLGAHSHAHVDTSFTPADGIAVSHPRWMPAGHVPMEHRA